MVDQPTNQMLQANKPGLDVMMAGAAVRDLMASLVQAQGILEQIGDDHYRARQRPSGSQNDADSTQSRSQERGTVGCHFRHLLDLCRAVVSAVDRLGLSADTSAMILLDYDARRRDSELEKNRLLAYEEVSELLSRCSELEQHKQLAQLMSAQVLIKTEHNGATCSAENAVQAQPLVVASTMAREMNFAALHATHHFALVNQLLVQQGITVAQQAAVAPATKRFFRESDQKASALNNHQPRE